MKNAIRFALILMLVVLMLPLPASIDAAAMQTTERQWTHCMKRNGQGPGNDFHSINWAVAQFVYADGSIKQLNPAELHAVERNKHKTRGLNYNGTPQPDINRADYWGYYRADLNGDPDLDPDNIWDIYLHVWSLPTGQTIMWVAPIVDHVYATSIDPVTQETILHTWSSPACEIDSTYIGLCWDPWTYGRWGNPGYPEVPKAMQNNPDHPNWQGLEYIPAPYQNCYDFQRPPYTFEAHKFPHNTGPLPTIS